MIKRGRLFFTEEEIEEHKHKYLETCAVFCDIECMVRGGRTYH